MLRLLSEIDLPHDWADWSHLRQGWSSELEPLKEAIAAIAYKLNMMNTDLMEIWLEATRMTTIGEGRLCDIDDRAAAEEALIAAVNERKELIRQAEKIVVLKKELGLEGGDPE